MSTSHPRMRISDVFWCASAFSKNSEAFQRDFDNAAFSGRTWRLLQIARLLDVQNSDTWGYAFVLAAKGGHLETLKAIRSRAGFDQHCPAKTAICAQLSSTAEDDKKLDLSTLSAFSGSLHDWVNIAAVHAVLHEHDDCANYLYDMGLDPAYMNYGAARYALFHGKAELAARLLNTVTPITDVHQCDDLLEMAVSSQNPECVRLAIQHAARFSAEELEYFLSGAHKDNDTQLIKILATATAAPSASEVARSKALRRKLGL